MKTYVFQSSELNKMSKSDQSKSMYVHADEVHNAVAHATWKKWVIKFTLFAYLTQTALGFVPAYAQTVRAAAPVISQQAQQQSQAGKVRAIITPAEQAPAGQKPLVDAAANGVPIVLIAPPNAGGISHNLYADFNVGQNGVILNNSKGNASTQLGGIIAGNLQLGMTTARLILNEVTSSNPSQLNGFIEVAGQKADIVIANPNGISCDGCGFINTNGRVTLTTGKLMFDGGGNLNSFDVRSGVLTVGGKGLNANNLEQLDLFARGIVIEGEISAKNLNAILGSNKILHGTLTAAPILSAGGTPNFAIDIAELGGMYANQIYLIATDKGLGVNSRGRIASLEENLSLSAQGDVTLKDNYSKKNVEINSTSNVNFTGKTSAENNISVVAPDSIKTNTGSVLLSEQLISLNTKKIDNSGSLIQRSPSNDFNLKANDLANHGQVYSATNLNLQAQRITATTGGLQAENSLRLQAPVLNFDQQTLIANKGIRIEGDHVSADRAVIQAPDVHLQAQNTLNITNSQLSADKDLHLLQTGLGDITQSSANTGSALVLNGSKLSAKSAITLQGDGVASKSAIIVAPLITLNAGIGRFDNQTGTLFASKELNVSVVGVSNAGGQIASTNKLALDVQGGKIDNSSGLISAPQSSLNNVSSLKNASGNIITQSDLSLTGEFDNQKGQIVTEGSLTIHTQKIENQGGLLQARNAINLNAISGNGISTINNDDGAIQSTHSSVTLKADQIKNANAAIAANSLVIQTQTLNANAAKISAQGAVDLSATKIEMLGATIFSSENINVTAESQHGGKLVAQGDVTVNVRDGLSLQGGGLVAGRTVNANATGIMNDNAVIQAKQVNLNAGSQSLSNQNGEILALGRGGAADAPLQIHAAGIDNRGGVLFSQSGAVLDVKNQLLDNSAGKITVVGDVNLIANTTRNIAGLIEVGNSINFIDKTLDNSQGKLVSGGDVAINAYGGSFQNNGGTIVAKGNLDVTSGNLQNSGASLAASGGINIAAEAIDSSSSSIRAGAGLTISAAKNIAIEHSTISSGDSVSLSGENIHANASSIASNGSVALNVARSLDMKSSDVQAIGSINLNASTLNADGSALLSNDFVSLVSAGEINFQSGSINAGKGVSVGALDKLNLQGAQITSNGAMTLSGINVDASGGRFVSAKDGAILATTENLNLDASTIISGASLQIGGNGVKANNANIAAKENISITVNDGIYRANNALHRSQSGDITVSANNIEITANGVIASPDPQHGILASGNINLIAKGDINSAGNLISAGKNVAITTDGNVNNTAGQIQANKEIKLIGADINNSAGVINAKEMLALTAKLGSVNNQSGSISSGAQVNINTLSGLNRALGKPDSTSGQVELNNINGSIVGVKGVNLNTGIVENKQGKIASGSDLNIDIGSTDFRSISGSLQSAGVTHIKAGSIDLHQGKVETGLGISFDTNKLKLQDATVSVANGDLKFKINNAGTIEASGSLLKASGNIEITAGNTNLDRASLVSGVDTKLKTADVSAQKMQINAGGNIGIASANLRSQDAQIFANGSIHVKAAQVQGGHYAAIGDIQLSATGSIDLSLGTQAGSLVTDSRLDVQAQGITLDRAKLIGKQVSLDAGNAALNIQSGTILATDNAINANSLQINSVGFNANNARISSNSNASIQANNALFNNQGGQIASVGLLTIQAGDINNVGGIIGSNQNATIQALALNNQQGNIQAGKQLSITSSTLDNRGAALIGVEGVLVNTSTLNNSLDALIASNVDITLNTSEFNNSDSQVVAGGNAKIIAKQAQLGDGKINNEKGKLLANGSLYLSSDSDINNQSGVITAKDILHIQADGSFNNYLAKLSSDKQLTLNAKTGVNNQAASIVSGADIDIQTQGDLDNANAKIIANNDTSILAKNINNKTALISAGGSLNLNVQQLGGAINNQNATIQALGSANIKAQGVDNQAGFIIAKQNLEIDSGSAALDNRSGILQSLNESLHIKAADINNFGAQSVILAAKNIQIQNTGNVNNQLALIDAGAELNIRSLGKLSNSQGNILAGTNGLVDAFGIDNRQASIAANGHLSVQANTGALENNNAKIIASNTLTLGAQTLNNSNGIIAANDDVVIASDNKHVGGRAGSLVNTAGLIQSTNANVSLVSGDLLNQNNGQIKSHKNITISASGLLNNMGSAINATQELSVNASAKLTNSNAQLIGVNKLTVVANGISSTQGVIGSNGTVVVDAGAGSLENKNSSITGMAGVTLRSVGAFSNIDSVVKTQGDLLANVGDLSNHNSLLSAQGKATFTTRNFDNQQSNIIGEQALSINTQGQTLTSQSGQFASNGDVSFKVGNTNLSNDKIAAGKAIQLETNALVANNVQIAAKDDIQIDSGDSFLQSTEIRSEKSVNLRSQNLVMQSSMIAAQNAINTKATGIKLDAVSMSTQQDLNVEAGSSGMDVNNTKLTSGANLNLLAGIGGGRLLFNQVDMQAENYLTVTGGAMDLNGRLHAVKGDLTIEGHQIVTRGVSVNAGQDIRLTGTGELDNTKVSYAVGRDIYLKAQGINNRANSFVSNGYISLDAGSGMLDNRLGIIASAASNVNIVSGEINNTQNGSITAQNALQIQAGTTQNATGKIASNSKLTIDAGQLNNTNGTLLSNTDSVTLTGGSVDNTNSSITAATNLTIDIGGSLSNVNGKLMGGDSTKINANTLVDNRSGMISSRGQTIVSSRAGDVNNSAAGKIQSETESVTVSSKANLNNQQGEIYGVSAANVIAEGTFNNAQGKLISPELVNIQAGRLENKQGLISSKNVVAKVTVNFDNQQGLVTSDERIQIDTNNLNNGDGIIAAKKDIAMQATGSISNTNGVISGIDGVKIKAINTTNNAGVIEAGAGGIQIEGNLTNSNSGSARGIVSLGDIRLTGSTATVTQNAGYIGASGQLSIDVANVNNTNNSQLIGLTDLKLNASSSITNQNSSVKSGTNLTVTADTLTNTAGTFLAADNLIVTANTINNNATNSAAYDKGLLAGADAIISANILDNSSGAIIALNQVKVTAADTLNNAGGKLSGNDVTIATANFDSAGGRVDAQTLLDVKMKNLTGDGTLASLGVVKLTADDDFTNNATIAAVSSLEITANGGKYANNGNISSHQNLTLNANSLENKGKITSQNTTINVGELNNGSAGVINSNQLTTVNAGITNNFGKIYGTALEINGAVKNQADATIASRGNLSINGTLTNMPGANVISLGDMQLGNVINAGARIEAAGNISIGNLSNRNCVQGSGGGGSDASDCASLGLQAGVTVTTETKNQAAHIVTIIPSGGTTGYSLSELETYTTLRGGTAYKLVAAPYTKFEDYTEKIISNQYTLEKVVNSANPGIVRSGGSISVGSGQNIDSQITAAGNISMGSAQALDLDGDLNAGDTTNILTRGTKSVTESGTSVFSKIVNDCDWKGSCKHVREYDPKLNFQTTTNTTSKNKTVVFKVESNSVSAAIDPAAIDPASSAVVVTKLGAKLDTYSRGLIDKASNTDGGQAVTINATDVAQSAGGTSAGRAVDVVTVSSPQKAANVETQTLAQANAVVAPTANNSGAQLANADIHGNTSNQALSINALQQANNKVSQLTINIGSTPQVQAKAISNALPGSVIAGAARASQETRIDQISTQFAAYAALIPTAPVGANGEIGGPLKAVGYPQTAQPIVNGTTLTTNTPWKVPAGNLFNVNAKTGAAYLIETDPTFTDQQRFLGSDYFLRQLNLDPERSLKRYGDGFVEQRAVADQLVAMTGRANLGGYNSEQGFQALMDAGVAYAKEYQLTPGVALSAQQMAQLTTDIVWLQASTVTLADGSHTRVLVPQVYLRRPQGGDLDTSGALIAANNISIRNKNGDINNTGTLLAGVANARETGQQGQLILTANNVNNQGTLAANMIVANADKDINNLGGKIIGLSNSAGNANAKLNDSSNDSLIALKAGGDINIASNTRSDRNSTLNKNGSRSESSTTNIDRIATLAAGNIQVDAAGNFTARGAQIGATNNFIATAGKDIQVIGVQESRSLAASHNANYFKESSTTNVVSNINAGNNLSLIANANVNIAGSNLNARNDLGLQGSNVTIAATKNSNAIDIQSITKNSRSRSAQNTESISGGKNNAGNNLTVIATAANTNTNANATGTNTDQLNALVSNNPTAAGNINITGATLNAETGVTSVIAKHDINITELITNSNSIATSSNKSSNLLKSKNSNSNASASSSAVNSSTVSGNQVVLQAGNDIKVQGSNVIAINDLTLNAARDLKIISAVQSDGSTQSSQTKTSGITASYSSGVASIGIGTNSSNAQGSSTNITQHASSVGSLQGNATLTAGETLQVIASDIAASQNLTLIGKNVDLSAAQNTNQSTQSAQSKNTGIAVGVTLNPVAAFKDAYSASTKNSQSGSTVGKSISQGEGFADGLNAASTALVVQLNNKQSNTNQQQNASTAGISSLTAGKDLNIISTDGNINSQGTQISAEGNALLFAKNDINLDGAHNTQGQDQATKSSGLSIDNRSRLIAGTFNNKGNGAGTTDTITGTQLSIGGSTTLATEKGDIQLIATNIASQGDVNINAAKNLSITSGQDTANNANQSNNKAIGQVVISDTERFAGYHNEKSKDNNSQVTQVASNVASLGGNIKLTAGDQYTQTASNVLAKGDIGLTAKTVDITTANNTGSQSQDSSDLKIGAFARVSSPLIDLVNNVEAARKSDGRLQTMQNMAAGANAYQTASAVSSLAGGAGSGTLIKGEVGIGFASSSDSNNGNSSTAQGSTIRADGNVNITSTKGDITAQGATISAGQNTGTVTLDSANNINLLASQSTNQSAGQNKNAGVEVGVGYQIGAQTGAYAYVAANVGSGNNNANETINNNTRLTGNTINLNSQGDTTLKGATATANTINTDVKGKLSIESLQDSSQQSSSQTNVGGRVQVSFGTAWEASGSVSQNKGSGASQAVKEQSGLIAGEGGYHIKADTVDLKDGVIASTNPSKSDLSTNALTFQNIENKMDYQASSVSMAGGIGGSSSNANGSSGSGTSIPQSQHFGDAKGGNVTLGLPSQTKGSDQSTTYATISEGNITIAGKSTTAKALGINTDVAKANQQIATAPNIKHVLKEQQAMSAGAGTVIATSKQVAGDIASNAAKTQDRAQKIIDDKTSTPEQIAEAKKVQAEAKQTQSDWSAGGIYNQALGVVTALTVDKTAGQGGAATANAVGAVVAKQIGDIAKAKDWEEGSPEKVILHGLAGLVQAKLGGTSELSGFTSGATKEAVTPLMESFLKSQGYSYGSAEFNDMMKLGSTLVGAATGAVVGGGAQNINVGANIALNAEQNNRQLHYKEAALIKALANNKAKEQCRGNADCEKLATIQWTDAMERVAKSLVDTKEQAKNEEYLSSLVQASSHPNSEGARGRLDAYVATLKTAQAMLAPYMGEVIMVNGVPSINYGTSQTYFSATTAQRNDDHINTNIFGEKPNSIIPLMHIRDEDRVERLHAQNGSATPVYPLEELLIGGAVGNRLATAAGRWLASLDEVVAGKVTSAGASKLSEVETKALAAKMNNFYRDGTSPELVQKTFNQAALSSTHNATSSEVVLGKYIPNSSQSYEAVAEARGATYFSMSDWSVVQGQLGADQMWNINKAFLDQQIAQGKKFLFTADPSASTAGYFTKLEYQHLINNGYRVIKDGGYYRAIKK
ncbi:hemagglutinin repeat-containing protein [Undibacterium danionis]|uniref:Hemagglutinin repeat-containing protein n=1 Tax=Undibacterium danionis TaxID=1812100 RepID=A0ABV6IFV1_9BURK